MSQSVSRKNILEALDVLGQKGASKEELFSLIGDMSRQAIAITLWRCMQAELVSENNERYYLSETLENPVAKQIQPYSNRHSRIVLPENAKGRSGYAVSVYSSPVEESNIVQVQMCFHDKWLKVPMFGNMRICTGPDIPKWSEYQEVNTDISVVRLIKKNGEYHDVQIARGYPVTIAYEE